jgi:hypothetical protein
VKWARRRPSAAALVIGSVVTVLAFVGVLMWFTAQLRTEGEKLRIQRDLAEGSRQLAEEQRTLAEAAQRTALLREETEALHIESEARLQEFEAGRGTLSLLINSIHALADVQLELQSDAHKRQRIASQALWTLQRIEESNTVRYKAGRIAITDFKQSTAARMDAEIALLRELPADTKVLPDYLDRKAEPQPINRGKLLQDCAEAYRVEMDGRLVEFRAGRGTLHVLLECIQHLLTAQLRLTDEPRQQIMLQEKVLELLREIESTSMTRFNDGKIPVQDRCRAITARLEVQIALLQARGRATEGATSSRPDHTLLGELVAELRTETNARQQEFLAGRGTLELLLQSIRLLQEAEVRLNDDPEEQVAVHENALRNLREAERINEARFEAGRIAIMDRALTIAARVRAERALLAARSRAELARKHAEAR